MAVATLASAYTARAVASSRLLLVILACLFCAEGRPSRETSFTARRAEAAVVGGLVADAATMPVHWIYDQSRVQQLVDAEGGSGAFLHECHCPFYSHPSGRLSVYGEELWPLLESVAEDSKFSATKFRERFYIWASSYDSHLNHIAKVFLQKWNAGEREQTAHENNVQAHALTKAVILAARYSSRGGLFDHLDLAVAVHQDSERARAAGRAAASVLRAVVEGQGLWAAVEAAARDEDVPQEGQAMLTRTLQISRDLMSMELSAATGTLKKGFLSAVQQEGLSCDLPGALVNSVMTALVFPSYEEAVLQNGLAAGDSCSRAILVGALLGAAQVKEYGNVLDFIPRDWQEKTFKLREIQSLAQSLRQDVGSKEL